MQSAQVVTLTSGQQNASSLESNRLTQNRQCTHLSFVQAQDYRVVLKSRAIRKLNHKSETVRIRLRGIEAFMGWVVARAVRFRTPLWQIRTLKRSPGTRTGLFAFSAGCRPTGTYDRSRPRMAVRKPSIHFFPAIPARNNRKSTRLNSSHDQISYAVFCLKKKKPCSI